MKLSCEGFKTAMGNSSMPRQKLKQSFEKLTDEVETLAGVLYSKLENLALAQERADAMTALEAAQKAFAKLKARLEGVVKRKRS